MSAPKRLLITGATGFVGQCLVPYLQDRGYDLRLVGRREVGDFDGNTDWSMHLNGVDAVIHLAGRAHVMQETQANPIDIYRQVNRDGTLRLARQAQDAGIGRFVFMSSVKVMGERSGHPLSGRDTPAPCDPYGISKHEAEIALADLGSAMDVVSLRPPMVYGPGVKGNFLTLLKAVRKGLPLPLGAVHNKRSMIYVGNLAAAVEAALTCPAGSYLPSDGQDLSTAGLIRLIADSMGKKPCLPPVPIACLRLAGRLTGRSGMIQRLTDSLQVDGKIPGWQPPYTPQQGIADTVNWYLRQ